MPSTSSNSPYSCASKCALGALAVTGLGALAWTLLRDENPTSAPIAEESESGDNPQRTPPALDVASIPASNLVTAENPSSSPVDSPLNVPLPHFDKVQVHGEILFTDGSYERRPLLLNFYGVDSANQVVGPHIDVVASPMGNHQKFEIRDLKPGRYTVHPLFGDRIVAEVLVNSQPQSPLYSITIPNTAAEASMRISVRTSRADERDAVLSASRREIERGNLQNEQEYARGACVRITLVDENDTPIAISDIERRYQLTIRETAPRGYPATSKAKPCQITVRGEMVAFGLRANNWTLEPTQSAYSPKYSGPRHQAEWKVTSVAKGSQSGPTLEITEGDCNPSVDWRNVTSVNDIYTMQGLKIIDVKVKVARE